VPSDVGQLARGLHSLNTPLLGPLGATFPILVSPTTQDRELIAKNRTISFALDAELGANFSPGDLAALLVER